MFLGANVFCRELTFNYRQISLRVLYCNVNKMFQDQALLTAPLFVLLEVLFFIGYRKKFHDKVMQQVRINVREFKNQQKKKK